MNEKKSFILRYDLNLQEKIDQLAKFRSYAKSKNKGIILAIKIAQKVLEKAQSVKANKDEYDVRKYIQDKYDLSDHDFW